MASLAIAVVCPTWSGLRRLTTGERPQVDDVIWRGDVRLSTRRSFVSWLLSEIAAGMGASMGREAPRRDRIGGDPSHWLDRESPAVGQGDHPRRSARSTRGRDCVGAFALVGAAAMIGAALQAPLARLVLAVELTHPTMSIIVAMIVATFLATALSRAIDGSSISPARLPAPD